jgi:hypothetical protein
MLMSQYCFHSDAVDTAVKSGSLAHHPEWQMGHIFCTFEKLCNCVAVKLQIARSDDRSDLTFQ